MCESILDSYVRRLEETVLYLTDFAEEQGIDFGLAGENGLDLKIIWFVRKQASEKSEPF